MKSFLFDPCDASLNCENCFQLSNLNLLKSKIFHQTRKNDTLKISEPRYCSKVLHGNWFEDRAEYKPPPDEWETSYNSLFKLPHSQENFNITLENRAALKKFKERSKGVGHEQLIEHHGDAYHNNFSTSYDLTYRVLPNGLNGPLKRKYNARGIYVPEQDLANNFGNITGYGYKEYIQRRDEELLEEAKDLPRTHYRCDFTTKKLPNVKRYPRKRADMNRPDLRHLDIDLEAKWGRQFTHGYHRLNLLQQRIHGLKY